MISWINASERLPAEKEPVILCKNEDNNFRKALIGCLIINEEGVTGWFVDGNGENYKVIAIESRNFWMPLVNKAFYVPDKPDKELAPAVNFHLSKLALFEDKFICLSHAMIKGGKGLYALDYYVSGIVSRALSLIYGFETLIKSANYMAAVHLVRPHLDNYLRLYAAWLVDKPHDFAREVWEGKPVKKIRDRNGAFMTDVHLKNKAVENHSWMREVYDETSGFVHFSNKHIANATNLLSEKEHTLKTFIGKTDNDVSNKHKLDAILCMTEISSCIAELIFGYLYTKRVDG